MPRQTSETSGGSSTSTEAALPTLIASDRPQEVDLAERGPMDIAEVEFTVGALPQHETGESPLPGGPNTQVRIGAVIRVEVLVHRPRGQRLENLAWAVPSTPADAQMPLHSVDDPPLA